MSKGIPTYLGTFEDKEVNTSVIKERRKGRICKRLVFLINQLSLEMLLGLRTKVETTAFKLPKIKAPIKTQVILHLPKIKMARAIKPRP